MNNDDRCYCNFTGNCPYCNENFFKEKYGMIVTPAMTGQENSTITVWNDFELRAYFENDPDTYYVISTIYKNNLNYSGREGHINRVYKCEEKGEMPLGIAFIWETHAVTTDWRRRVLFVLEKYFDMEV